MLPYLRIPIATKVVTSVLNFIQQRPTSDQVSLVNELCLLCSCLEIYLIIFNDFLGVKNEKSVKDSGIPFVK